MSFDLIFLSRGTRLAILPVKYFLIIVAKLRFSACRHHNKRLIFAVYASIFVSPVMGQAKVTISLCR
jgi:hypothetical protein